MYIFVYVQLSIHSKKPYFYAETAKNRTKLFKKGDKKPVNSGRKPGVGNKMTRTVKEAVSVVFNKLQDEPDGNSDLESWARKRPGDFYQVAAKLIPTEVSATVTEKVIRVERE